MCEADRRFPDTVQHSRPGLWERHLGVRYGIVSRQTHEITAATMLLTCTRRRFPDAEVRTMVVCGSHISINNVADYRCGYCWRSATVSLDELATRSLADEISRGENLTWRTPDSDAQSGIDFESAHWGLTGNSFDLIHAAHLCGSVSDWPRFFEKCKKYAILTRFSMDSTN